MQSCLEKDRLHCRQPHLVSHLSPFFLTLFGGFFLLLSLELDSNVAGTAFSSTFTVAILREVQKNKLKCISLLNNVSNSGHANL